VSSEALAQTLLPAGEGEVLELDELWSFVGSKKNRCGSGWCCVAERAKWWRGRGDKEIKSPARSCGPRCPSYKNAFCYSDLLVAYQNVLERKQHQACTKQEGQTNHRALQPHAAPTSGPPRPQDLSFSKSLFMHILSIRLFLHSYNQGQAQNYNASRAT
jgi:IS1 family transposase